MRGSSTLLSNYPVFSYAGCKQMPDLADSDTTLEESGGRSVEEEFLDVLATQASRVPIPVLTIGIITAAMAANYFPAVIWGGWLALVVAVLTVRWKVLTWLPHKKQIPIAARINVAVSLSFVNGLVHAASTLFFPQFSITERTILTLMHAGLITGAVATTAGHKKTYLAFSMPIMAAQVVAWGTFRPAGVGYLVQAGIPLLVMLLGLILAGLAREYAKFFSESFLIRTEQKKLNAKLQDALDEAVAANQAKTRFLASASHDLRQPIHALSLFSAALAMRQLDQRTREIVSHMETAIENLATQMNALLDVSKLDAGLVEVNLEGMDLHGYLQQLQAEFTPQALEKGLDLRVTGIQPAYVVTDHELFDRVVRNILSNSIRYTDAGSVIINLAPLKNSWALSVTDTGRGIPEAEQSLVFEEFYQAGNPHRDRGQGLGLGLAIVKRLTSMLGITVDMHSTVGQGTTFRLTLPRHQGEVENDRGLLDDTPIAGAKILCVDDEAAVRTALETILGHMGCRVRAVAGTKEAVAAARSEQPDMIIADFRLAEHDDGLSTIGAIREFIPGVPALLITGDTAPDRLNIAAESGIPVLHKPITGDALVQCIHDHLAKAGGNDNG
jgi:signal transduction histidine kinase